MRIKTTPNKSYFFTNPNVGTTVQCVAYKNGVRISGGYNWRGMLTKDCDEYAFSFLKTEILSNDFQFEEGTIATSYELYKEVKKDILIKEPLRENDIMYEDNGQVKVNRYARQYTFTGNENLRVIDASLANCLAVRFNLENIKADTRNVLCNNFCYELSWNDKEHFFIERNIITFIINKTKLISQDVEGFKAWLKANPTTIVYQLAEPTVEIVENCVDIDLDTFGEKTYFNILNSIKGSLDFKVPSNIASIVQSNSKAINELYNLIDTLVLPNILQNTTDIEMLKLEKLK